MKIYSNGKDRELKGAFPKKFKLLDNGKDVPFLRTGKETVWLSDVIPFGELDIEEIESKKVPQPAKLDAQSLAIINKADFDKIDLLNKKLAINQEQMNAQMVALTEQEATLANLETQNAQNIDQTNLKMVEMAKAFGNEIKADRDSLKATANSIAKDIQDTAEILNANLEDHKRAKNPHKITKETVGLSNVDNTSDLDKPISKETQKALDQKADKSEIDVLDEKIKESGKRQDELLRNLETVNLYGGVGGNELPTGGKKGYVLAKKSNKDGDYEWKSGGGGVSVHNDLTGRSVANTHPISAITGLQDALTSETTNRENADNGLQSQIDAITASSDVKDIVGTYAQLQAYDTSTLGNNDIIKVLQDETHSDETTYYRWSTVTETFTLIGEEGPYYTKSEANSTFVPQTRKVNGKALSADISLTASDVGALPDNTTIGDATLTIQKNGTTIDTFTANAISNKTVNVTVPTDTSDLTNGAGFLTNTNDCVHISGVETMTSAKKIFANDEVMAGNQAAVFATISNSNSGNSTWIGRYICGAKNLTFLMGTYNNMAGLGAHSWTNAQTGSGAAWADFYLNPDGNKTVYIGGNAWTKDKGWFKVQNSGSNTGGKVQVNIGSVSSANWKDVAYKGENISDFNNNAGYTTNVGTVTSVNNTSPDGNGNVSLTIPSTASDVGALPDSTKYGADLSLTSGTLQLLDQDGNALGNSVTVPDASNFANTSLNNLDATGQGIIDGKVSKTGDTMTGGLTINMDGSSVGDKLIGLVNPTIDRSVAPSEISYEVVGFKDKNDNDVSDIYFRQGTDGNVSLRQRCFNQDGSSYVYTRMGYDSGGNPYYLFPDSTCVDGQWVSLTSGSVASDVSANGSSDLSFDISSFLPNDNRQYEVLVSVNATTGSSSGDYVPSYVYSDLFSSVGRYICFCRPRTRTSSSVFGGGCGIIPVGTGRKLYLIRSTNYSGTVSIDIRAYRRIGTNN